MASPLVTHAALQAAGAYVLSPDLTERIAALAREETQGELR
jgi:hypothetical protein